MAKKIWQKGVVFTISERGTTQIIKWYNHLGAIVLVGEGLTTLETNAQPSAVVKLCEAKRVQISIESGSRAILSAVGYHYGGIW
jgi:hypothetical protein